MVGEPAATEFAEVSNRDLIASKVISDWLKDHLKKRFLVLFIFKNRKIHDFQAEK